MKPISDYTREELGEVREALENAASCQIACADTIDKLLSEKLVPETRRADAEALRREGQLLSRGAELVQQLEAKRRERAA